MVHNNLCPDEDADVLGMNTAVLFFSRLALQLWLTRLAFCRVWTEAVVDALGFVVLLVAVSHRAIDSFLLLKTCTIFAGRVIMLGVRVMDAWKTGHGSGLSRQGKLWSGRLLAFLLALNIGEAVVTSAIDGYWGTALSGALLMIPYVTLPLPTSFDLRPTNGYYFGTPLPWIAGYTVWNVAFTMVLHDPTDPTGASTTGTVLANLAGLTADFVNSLTLHPTKWIHSRGQSLMWTLALVASLRGDTLGLCAADEWTLNDDAKTSVDVILGVGAITLCAVSVWAEHRGLPGTYFSLPDYSDGAPPTLPHWQVAGVVKLNAHGMPHVNGATAGAGTGGDNGGGKSDGTAADGTAGKQPKNGAATGNGRHAGGNGGKRVACV